MAQTSIVMATGTLTSAGVIADAETVTIGTKVYTFQDTLTDVDGNVHVGADAEGSLANLFAAINLSNDGESAVGAGTDYAASMTRNAFVVAISKTATTLVVGSPGACGNLVASTETGLNISWGGGTLSGGSGNIGKLCEEILDEDQPNSRVIASLLDLTPRAD